MNGLLRRFVSCIATLLAAVLVAGCSSGMGKDQCVLADWNMIGFEDGLQGWSADRIGVHRVACAQHQVTPNLAAYMEGRQRGLQEFCQPKNGFRVGLRGGGYANVCSGPTEPSFVNSYRYGRQIFDARTELRQTQARLRSARDGLSYTEAGMASVTTELVLPGIPTDRRAFLATELIRLTQERTELITRIDQLMARTQQLAVNVQELERQSPYAL
jgi:hypothetical protein